LKLLVIFVFCLLAGYWQDKNFSLPEKTDILQLSGRLAGYKLPIGYLKNKKYKKQYKKYSEIWKKMKEIIFR